MDKKEVQKRLKELNKQINQMISKGILFTEEQTKNMDSLYAEMTLLESLLDESEEDGD